MKKILLILGVLIILILAGIIMDNTRNKIWYQGSTMIDSDIESVKKSLSDIGKHYEHLISFYPGMTTVELIEQGKDIVAIKTNEGTMKRTNILVTTSEDKIVVEFDEEYITSMVTSNSHNVETFEAKTDNVEINIEISDLVAPGFLGFFLRNFGSKNIGNGFLDAYKKKFEK